MTETARLKHDLRAYKAMCRELVMVMCGASELEWLRVRSKAAKMLENERAVGE